MKGGAGQALILEICKTVFQIQRRLLKELLQNSFVVRAKE
jgi:hypothetical protein